MSTFTASNGYKVDRLADGQTKITRANVGVFEHVTWCGGDEYLAIAEHALSRQKVTDNTKLIDRAREMRMDAEVGTFVERMRVLGELANALQASDAALFAALGGAK